MNVLKGYWQNYGTGASGPSWVFGYKTSDPIRDTILLAIDMFDVHRDAPPSNLQIS